MGEAGTLFCCCGCCLFRRKALAAEEHPERASALLPCAFHSQDCQPGDWLAPLFDCPACGNLTGEDIREVLVGEHLPVFWYLWDSKEHHFECARDRHHASPCNVIKPSLVLKVSGISMCASDIAALPSSMLFANNKLDFYIQILGPTTLLKACTIIGL